MPLGVCIPGVAQPELPNYKCLGDPIEVILNKLGAFLILCEVVNDITDPPSSVGVKPSEFLRTSAFFLVETGDGQTVFASLDLWI